MQILKSKPPFAACARAYLLTNAIPQNYGFVGQGQGTIRGQYGPQRRLKPQMRDLWVSIGQSEGTEVINRLAGSVAVAPFGQHLWRLQG
ncbi:MAG: hypothetical protein OXL33_03810, partial [Chloroflexota bacterium]|nr:hypothetical protein [Chloroflexota bacterium]